MKPKTGLQTLYLLFALSIIGSYKVYSQSSSIIDAHFKSLESHNVAAIASGYANNAEVYSPNWEGAKKGREGVSEVYSRYFKSTPDITYKVIHVISAGDNVVVEYTSTGTLSNPENGTPAYMKDKKYTLNYCAVYKLKNGKIIYEADYFDQVAFLRQVGFFDQH
jgi:steroid delta-isomerase-like uncharacterized protein